MSTERGEDWGWGGTIFNLSLHGFPNVVAFLGLSGVVYAHYTGLRIPNIINLLSLSLADYLTIKNSARRENCGSRAW
jgi:hypothetical protein